jgi:hypothetical protein
MWIRGITYGVFGESVDAEINDTNDVPRTQQVQ